MTKSKVILILTVVIAGMLTLAVVASARTTEYGSIDSQPSCPGSPCFVLSKTTGFQVGTGSGSYPVKVRKSGRLVSWKIALSSPTPKQQKFFEETLGGAATAKVSVLRRVKLSKSERKKYKTKHRYVVTGESDPVKLKPYFGMTAEFALKRTLKVKKDYIVALTTTTWTPALSIGLSNKFAWRSSGTKKQCDDPAGNQTAVERKEKANYECLYRTAQLAYSFRVVSTP